MISLTKLTCIISVILYGIVMLPILHNYLNTSQLSESFKHVVVNYYLQEDSSNKTKFILYWSPFFGRWDYYWGYGYDPFKNCEYSNCFTTKNRSIMPLKNFDAILFHAVYKKEKHGVPDVRSPHQIYVLLNLESPANMPQFKFDSLKSYFNWTMTYRLDSDVVNRYGYVFRKKTNYARPSKELLQKKFGAVWVASHCNTSGKREVLVEELQKFYKIDIYGRCGNLKCKFKCNDMFEQKYKFYLSFENSYCKDYVTEKLFNILQFKVVPIVYSGGISDAVIPSKSMINVVDFKHAGQLAEYLNYLDNNSDEYVKYLEWKKDYVVNTKPTVPACDLCKKLHQPLKKSIHETIDSWWSGEPNNSVCKSGKDLPEIVSSLLIF